MTLFLPLLLGYPLHKEQPKVLLSATTQTVDCTFMLMEQDVLHQPGISSDVVGGDGASYAQCIEDAPSNKRHFLHDDQETEQYNDGDRLRLTLETDDTIVGEDHYEKLVRSPNNKIISALVVKKGAAIKAERRAKYNVKLSAPGEVNEMDIIMSAHPPAHTPTHKLHPCCSHTSNHLLASTPPIACSYHGVRQRQA